MATEAEILCFRCGQQLLDPPEVPTLPDGEPCPACRDRLLDLLPAPLPRRFGSGPSPAASARDTEREGQLDSPGE